MAMIEIPQLDTIKYPQSMKLSTNYKQKFEGISCKYRQILPSNMIILMRRLKNQAWST